MWAKVEWPETATISGQLMKLTRSKYSTGPRWQPRWFAFEGESCVLYYGLDTSSTPKKIDLREANVMFQSRDSSDGGDILTLTYDFSSLSIASPHKTVTSVWHQRITTAKSEFGIKTEVISPSEGDDTDSPPLVDPSEWLDDANVNIETEEAVEEVSQEVSPDLASPVHVEEWVRAPPIMEPCSPPGFVSASDSDEEDKVFTQEGGETSSIFSCFGIDTNTHHNKLKDDTSQEIAEEEEVSGNIKVSFRVKKSTQPPPEEPEEESTFAHFFGSFNPLMGEW